MLLYELESDRDFGFLRTKLLVSCPAGESNPGGMYLLDFARNRAKQLYEGSCSGFVKLNDKWIVATDQNELLVFDRMFQLTARTKYGKLDFHGIAAFGDRSVLVAETSRNAIGCYDTVTFERIGEIRCSPEEKDVQHINDLWLENETLYVSMFSANERWFVDPLRPSGVITAIDVTSFRPGLSIAAQIDRAIVASGLHMPHSVIVNRGKLAYCDSMAFRAVLGGGAEVQLPGFTRGLAADGDVVFIGQSRMRHVLRIPHRFSNCSLDAGIYVYRPEHRISRFIPLPVQQVYQIAVLEPESPLGEEA